MLEQEIQKEKSPSFRRIKEALTRPSLSEQVATSSLSLATARQELVLHWCGSLSEQFATVRHEFAQRTALGLQLFVNCFKCIRALVTCD
ncbi:hypothetical protein L195_g043308 [Trifolium pratense]|uniref:Uncharacterized protein n=1 Tax=Trifolium pratense TaxID=57577 RepID=A0A2K3M8V2_TRIPR|nr:hypothetical protein L195_g043308 [Trifolium pratense]